MAENQTQVTRNEPENITCIIKTMDNKFEGKSVVQSVPDNSISDKLIFRLIQ